jgi:hypothetical protein
VSNFTRGNTFASDAVVTPAGLNDLVEAATVTNVSLDELGADFKSIFYGSTDPGITNARIWYDTTAGIEGLKYAFVSPSNASIAGWLYATPRREAYYWASTTVSIGSPMVIGRYNDVETQMALHLFDGLALMKTYPVAGSTVATDVNTAWVVAQEARVGAGPVRCAWAGLIAADTFSSNISQSNPLYIDHHSSLKFTESSDVGTTLLDSLSSYWHLNEATGATRPDVSANGNHLPDAGGTDVDQAAGKIDNAAAYSDDVAQKLEVPDNATLDMDSTDFSFSVWAYVADLASNRVVFAKNNNADGGREYHLRWAATPTAYQFVVFDGTGVPQTNRAGLINATTFGSPSLNTWHCIQGYFDVAAAEIGLRVNGGAWDTTTATNSGHAGNSNFTVGLFSDNVQPWSGRIDELAFWKRRLSDSEFDSVYNSGDAQDLEAAVGTPALARSSIFGTVLHNVDNSVPNQDAPVAMLWGTGPVVQDIDQR